MKEIKHKGYTQFQVVGKKDLFLCDICRNVCFGGYDEEPIKNHVKNIHKIKIEGE